MCKFVITTDNYHVVNIKFVKNTSLKLTSKKKWETDGNISIRFAYAIGDASWKNGFDDNASTTSADDTESKAAAIVDKIYHFNLSPFRIQLRTKSILKFRLFL